MDAILSCWKIVRQEDLYDSLLFEMMAGSEFVSILVIGMADESRSCSFFMVQVSIFKGKKRKGDFGRLSTIVDETRVRNQSRVVMFDVSANQNANPK